MAIPVGIPVINLFDILRRIRFLAAKVISSKLGLLFSISVAFGGLVSALLSYFDGFIFPDIINQLISSSDIDSLGDDLGFLTVAKYILRIDLILSIVKMYIQIFESLVIFILTTSFSMLVLGWVIRLKSSAADDIREVG